MALVLALAITLSCIPYVRDFTSFVFTCTVPNNFQHRGESGIHCAWTVADAEATQVVGPHRRAANLCHCRAKVGQ